MRITIGQLRRIIREEVSRSLHEGVDSVVSSFKKRPEEHISPSLVRTALGKGNVSSDYKYRAVYDLLVKQDANTDEDIEYWDEETSSWRPITDEMRHHPVSVHNPS